MVFGLFGKKKKAVELLAPMSGEVRPITEVPDPVFSQKMLGDGFCLIPSDGRVVAPISGKVVNLFPTGHAVGLQSPEGLEVLVHVGIDTVKLKGEGFRPQVQQGAEVTAGQPLIEVELERVRAGVPSLATPVVLTNLGDRPWRLTASGMVPAGEVVGAVEW